MAKGEPTSIFVKDWKPSKDLLAYLNDEEEQKRAGLRAQAYASGVLGQDNESGIAERELRKKEEEEKNRPSLFKRAQDVGRAIYQGAKQSYDTVAGGLVEAAASDTTQAKILDPLNLIKFNNAGDQQGAQAILEQTRQRVLETLRDPNIPQDRKDKLLQMFNDDIRESVIQQAAATQELEQRTNPRRFTAAAYEVGLTPFLASPTGLTRGGTALAGKAAAGADIAGGVAGGLLGAASQEELNPQSLATGAAIGAALPVAGAGARRLTGWLEDKRLAEAARKASFTNEAMPGFDAPTALLDDVVADGRVITDPARLLPDGSESKAVRLAEIDDELDQLRLGKTDPNVYQSSLDETTALAGEPAGNAKLTKAGDIDQRSSKTTGVFAQDTGKTVANSQSTAQRARELMKERKQLEAEIAAIKDPNLRLAEEVNLVDADLARAQRTGTPGDVKRATANQAYMNEEVARADLAASNQAVLDISPTTIDAPTGSTSKPMAAQRTEALAIEKKLADGFDIEATPRMSMADQAAQGEAIYRTSRDDAIRMAMGTMNPPGNVQPSTMYKVVEHFAEQEGDWKTLKRLAEESTIPGQGKAYGQYNAAFAYKSPTSTLDAMQDVMQSRKKLGGTGELTDLESERLTKMSNAVTKAKDNFVLNKSDEARRLYGEAQIAFDNYKAELVAAGNPKLSEALKTGDFYKRTGNKLLGLPKSIVASLDNSALLRQGWKTLWTNPKTWAKNSAKSFKDIARTYGGKEVMDSVHADIVSRDNMLNGLYRKAGIDVYGAKKDFLEEAFPTSFQGVTNNKAARVAKTPFKASEVAYSAWQQRTRADLFDHYIKDFVNRGGDLSNTKDVKAIGQMVNSLTGRGQLPKFLERGADTWNKVFFAPRLVQSHIDVLGGHMIGGAGGSNYVRKRAAQNLVQIAAGSAATLAVTSAALGGKIELDPRSSDFGKLRIGDTRFDLSGGMAGLLTLGARIAPMIPGVPGNPSTKSASTGEVKELNTGEYGSRTTMGVIADFASNKLSPIARVITDQMEGKNFEGEKPTVASVVKSLTMPLIIQQYSELKDSKNAANTVATLIAEGLGIGSNTYGLESNWNANNSKQITEFKKRVSNDSFKKAEDQFNTEFQDWYKAVSESDKFWKLPMDKRESLVTSKKNDLTKKVLERYGYKYERKKTDNDTKAVIEELKKYY